MRNLQRSPRDESGGRKSELVLPRVLQEPSEDVGDVEEMGREALVGTAEGMRREKKTREKGDRDCDDETQLLCICPEPARVRQRWLRAREWRTKKERADRFCTLARSAGLVCNRREGAARRETE